MKKKLLLFFILTAFFSCKKERKIIHSEKGNIDIVTNIYFNASKGLDEVKSIYLSKLNYKNNDIIEYVPNPDMPQWNDVIFYIKGNKSYDITDIINENIVFSNIEKSREKPIQSKKIGAVFSNEKIKDFDKRKELTDTILFEKNYKRFEIKTNNYLSIYYIHPNDTIYPYQIYPYESNIYNGRIERIDTYYKKKDIFISWQLFHKKKWDSQAKDIFEFNEFIQKKERN